MRKSVTIRIINVIASIASTGVILMGCAADIGDPPTEVVKENVTNSLLLPSDIREAQSAVRASDEMLAACIGAAPDPTSLTACREDYVQSLASILNVSPPSTHPIASAIGCAESAARCILGLGISSKLVGCATRITTCTVTTAVGAVGDVANIAGDLVGDVATVAGGVASVAGGVVGGTVQVAGGIVGGAVNVAGDVISGVADAAGNIVGDVVNTAGQVVRTAGDLVGDVAHVAGDVIGDVADGVTHAIDNLDDVVKSINQCTADTAGCVKSSSRPSDITSCAETQVECVSDTLGVVLPEIPLSEATACTERAVDCALAARSIKEVNLCASGLTSCATNVVAQTPVIDCSALFSKCLISNRFNFALCAQKARDCSKP